MWDLSKCSSIAWGLGHAAKITTTPFSYSWTVLLILIECLRWMCKDHGDGKISCTFLVVRWGKMWLDWKVLEVLGPPPVGIKYIVMSIRSQSIMFSTPSLWGEVYLRTYLIVLRIELILGLFTSHIYIADDFSGLSLTRVIVPATENIAGLGFVRSLAPISPEHSDFWLQPPANIWRFGFNCVIQHTCWFMYGSSTFYAIFEPGKMLFRWSGRPVMCSEINK